MATGRVNGVLRCLRRAALGQDGGGMADGQLLACFLADRDDAAFAALVRRHGPMVLQVCRRVLGNAEDAEDAFQATFLVLARKAATIARRELLGNWLYGVAYRAALEARAARPTREKQVKAIPEPGVADEADDFRDLRPLLDQELNRLPEKYRVPVVLCDLEGRPRREVARQLGLPEGTLSGRLTTARRTLARRLTQRGVALSGGALVAVLSQGAASARLPAALVSSTTKAATEVAAGSAATAVVSAKVAALTEGVLKTMFLSQLKSAGAALLMCLTLAGAALLTPGHPTAVADGRAVPAAVVAIAEGNRRAAKQAGFVFTQDDTIYAAAYSPNDKHLATGGGDKKVHLWDVGISKVTRTLEGPKGTVRTIAFSKDSRTVAAGADDETVYLWDVATGKPTAELKAELPAMPARGKQPLGGTVFVNGLVFLPGGKLAATYNYDHAKHETRYSRIVLWDLQTKKAETLYEERGNSYSLALSPDGKLLAATLWGDTNGFKVWDLDGRKVVWEGQAGPDFMGAVVFSPDGTKLAVGGGHSFEVKGGFRCEGRLWLFDVKARKQLWHVKEPANWTYSQIAFTADSRGVLTGSSGPSREINVNGARGSKTVSEFRRWDAANGKEVWKLEGELGGVQSLAVSADGKRAAGSDSEQLMLFDPATGTMREVQVKPKR